MLSFDVSDPLCRGVPSATEIRDSAFYIMCVGREQLDQTLVKHAVCPILRIPAESASDRTGRKLHPNPVGRELAHGAIVLVDPSQTFGVRENWDVPCY